MGYREFTTDIPEYAHFQPKEFWDARARGLGGSRRDPVCSVAEENLLGFPGDPYDAECILIHEFAHNIHLRGLIRVDTSFDQRLKACYELALEEGLWRGKYASVNHNEYFAEGVQSWFNNNRPPDHDHNHVDTRVRIESICVWSETRILDSNVFRKNRSRKGRMNCPTRRVSKGHITNRNILAPRQLERSWSHAPH